MLKSTDSLQTLEERPNAREFSTKLLNIDETNSYLLIKKKKIWALSSFIILTALLFCFILITETSYNPLTFEDLPCTVINTTVATSPVGLRVWFGFNQKTSGEPDGMLNACSGVPLEEIPLCANSSYPIGAKFTCAFNKVRVFHRTPREVVVAPFPFWQSVWMTLFVGLSLFGSCVLVWAGSLSIFLLKWGWSEGCKKHCQFFFQDGPHHGFNSETGAFSGFPGASNLVPSQVLNCLDFHLKDNKGERVIWMEKKEQSPRRSQFILLLVFFCVILAGVFIALETTLLIGLSLTLYLGMPFLFLVDVSPFAAEVFVVTSSRVLHILSHVSVLIKEIDFSNQEVEMMAQLTTEEGGSGNLFWGKGQNTGVWIGFRGVNDLHELVGLLQKTSQNVKVTFCKDEPSRCFGCCFKQVE